MAIHWDKLGEYLLRLILLVRPKFYNRLTWVIVAAGLALMSTSLLEQLAILFLAKVIDINVTGGSDTVWGFALVVTALIYHLATTSLYELMAKGPEKKKTEETFEHDREVFDQANQILTTEQLDDFLSCVENDHSYRRGGSSRLEEFGRFLANDDNEFITDGLDKDTQALLRSLLVLLNFTSYKFFVYPPNQSGGDLRLCMTPDLNIDRGAPNLDQMKKYDELTAELEGHVDDLREKHRKWRAEIKRQLIR